MRGDHSIERDADDVGIGGQGLQIGGAHDSSKGVDGWVVLQQPTATALHTALDVLTGGRLHDDTHAAVLMLCELRVQR